MQPRSFAVAGILLFIFVFGDAGVITVAQSADRDQQSAREQGFLARREHFGSGREPLLNKRVPFDPDELLREGWREKLKPILDAMPEMHQVKYEPAPLQGAYLADTLYLPEQVQLSGHTIILANYVVFEGKKPVIKGNFDLHFFPAKPVAVLETSLSEALHKKAEVLNVKFGRRLILPSFALIQEIARPGVHHITFDVSGVSFVSEPSPKPKARLRNASWGEFALPSAPLQKQCTTSCDNNGDNGLPGATGQPGAVGQDGPIPVKAPNGVCGGIINGHGGSPGGDGNLGGDASPGRDGQGGQDGKTILVMIAPGDHNKYVFNANGGNGGNGGDGANGGTGGNGSRGGEGGDGVECQCEVGDGGDAGQGGDGGKGGNGSNGGAGGNGGKGGTITGTYPADGIPPDTSVEGGIGGQGGGGGVGGAGGVGGVQGQPGKGGVGCNKTGASGFGNFVGKGGGPGNPAQPGAPGQNGPRGTSNVVPSTLTAGGGGGTTEPCLGGQGSDPGTGTGFTGGGGGTAGGTYV